MASAVIVKTASEQVLELLMENQAEPELLARIRNCRVRYGINRQD
ncbi:MAG: hypothetical protein WA970_04130 [Gammaproteobacteria bacterium]